jgi:hypothetical protein
MKNFSKNMGFCNIKITDGGAAMAKLLQMLGIVK